MPPGTARDGIDALRPRSAEYGRVIEQEGEQLDRLMRRVTILGEKPV